MAQTSQIYHLLGEVLESRPLGAVHHQIVLRVPEIAATARPGQFVHCAPSRPGDPSPLLRRPISISGVTATSVGAPDCLELAFRVIGAGTRLIAARRPGELLDCLGPLGNGFTETPGKTALLIAGGMGIAPLRWLAIDLAAKGSEVYLLAGARSEEDFPYALAWQNDHATVPELETLGVQTEFVSEEQGDRLITDLLNQRLPELLAQDKELQAYMVGPKGMVKAVAELLPPDLPCQVSLEARMACGIGACRACVVALKSDAPEGYAYRRACKDGPVFNLRDIFWERESDVE